MVRCGKPAWCCCSILPQQNYSCSAGCVPDLSLLINYFKEINGKRNSDYFCRVILLLISLPTKSGLCEPAEGKWPRSRGVQTLLLVRSLAGRLTELSYLTIDFHLKSNAPVLNKQKEMYLLQFSVKSSPYSYPVTAGLKNVDFILYLISPVSFFIVYRNIFPRLRKQFLPLIPKAL